MIKPLEGKQANMERGPEAPKRKSTILELVLMIEHQLNKLNSNAINIDILCKELTGNSYNLQTFDEIDGSYQPLNTRLENILEFLTSNNIYTSQILELIQDNYMIQDITTQTKNTNYETI